MLVLNIVIALLLVVSGVNFLVWRKGQKAFESYSNSLLKAVAQSNRARQYLA